MSKQKLMAIDGNSILNRAFYGLPELLTTSDGYIPTEFMFFKYNA